LVHAEVLSVCTAGAALAIVVAFATGGIVARLIAVNAARMRIFIRILQLSWGVTPNFVGAEVGLSRCEDNLLQLDGIYAATGEIALIGLALTHPPGARSRGNSTPPAAA
jgi:hypothetical protein